MADLEYNVVVNYSSKGSPASGASAAGRNAQSQADAWAKRREQIQTQSALMAGRLAEKQVREEFAARKRAHAEFQRYSARNDQAISNAAGGIAGGAMGIMGGAVDAALNLTKWAAAGVTAAMSFGVHFNMQLENMQIGVAGIFQANGFGSFQKTMEASGDVIQRMQKDAAKLPGTFKELADTFQAVATPGLQAGMSINETEKFAANTLAMGVTNMLPARVAAREMRAMLQGQTHSQNILAQMMLPQMGMDLHSFNKLDPKERLAKINSIFAKYADAFKAYGDSFYGLFTTITSNLSVLSGKLSKPLFNSMKSSMKSFVSWMETNGEHLEALAERIGNAFARGWEFAERQALKVLAVVERISHHVNGKSLKSGAEAAGFAMTGATIGRAAMGVSGALGGGIEVLAPVLVALSVAAVAAYGAVNILTNRISNWHTYALAGWKDITESFSHGLAALGVAWENLRPTIMSIVDIYGVRLMDTLSGLGNIFQFLSGVIASVSATIGTAMATIKQSLPSSMQKAMGWYNSGYETHPGEKRDKFFTYKSLHESNLGDARHDIKVPNHTTHIHKVDIIVRSNEDPSRIARLTKDALINLGRNPGTSPSVRNFSRVQR